MTAVLHKNLLGRMLLLLTLLQQTACYDGWDEKVGSEEGPNIPTDPDAPKPLYLVLFEQFTLSTLAVNDSACFGATGTEQFRLAEWSQRISAATEALDKVSENVSVTRRFIDETDCTTLSTVEDASADPDPVSVTSIGEDSLGRPMVHLKAVFWDTDVSGAFTGSVTTPHWSAWRTLRSRGRPAVSLHYYSISNSTSGHFSGWRSALDANLILNATAINSVAPTDTGTQNRLATAIADANALANWTVAKAIEVAP